MTDMDRLIEDVARALVERIGSPWPYDEMSPSVQALWNGHATAAILATLRGIREPNFQMRRAADERDGTGDPHADIYRAMIDRLIQDFAPEGRDA